MLSSRSRASLSSTILLFDFPRTVANEIGIEATEISVILFPFHQVLRYSNVSDSLINQNFTSLFLLSTPDLDNFVLHLHLMAQYQCHF